MVLERASDLHVVAEVGDAERAVRTVLGHTPAVLVLDLNMPGELTSLEAIPRVREVSPDTRGVVLCGWRPWRSSWRPRLPLSRHETAHSDAHRSRRSRCSRGDNGSGVPPLPA